MTSLNTTMTSNSNLNFDELGWVIQIRHTLVEEIEDDSLEIAVSIFNVPKALMSSSPESYTPQQVAIGPYHYWRPELYEMQRYKLAAAKRSQKQLESLKFHNLVDQLITLEPRIRAYYHKYLDFNGETLAWMMAIDASFVLEFLQMYAIKERQVLARVTSRMSHLVDYEGKKSAHNAILRDMVMVENQIPLFVLRKTLEFQLSSLELSNDMVCTMLMGFCEQLSPFKILEFPKIQVLECCHLLDFLYEMIVPKSHELSEITVALEEEDQSESMDEKRKLLGKLNQVKLLLKAAWKLVPKANKNLVSSLIKSYLSKFVGFLKRLSWTIISKLPMFSLVKQPIENLLEVKDANKSENTITRNNINKPPSIEEIAIPSVTQLSKSGVHFLPSNGNISTITFNAKTGTFYLPTISLDVNMEVVLRNLVAYEASNSTGPLVFTRYTELMNGIIDTNEDLKILREKGIVLNHLNSDEEAVNMWNGMSKSIRLTKVPLLDKVIEDVNKFHSSRWNVQLEKFMKVYVFGSWKVLTLLATLMILFMMSLQAFCSAYSCKKTFDISITNDN